MKRLVILISGRGSNMAAIMEAVKAGAIPAKLVGVISNRPGAAGLALAAGRGVPTFIVDHAGFAVAARPHDPAVLTEQPDHHATHFEFDDGWA